MKITGLYRRLLVLCILFGRAGLRDGIASGQHPRQELSLNGQWEFLLDRENAGYSEQWYLQDVFSTKVIPVPWHRQYIKVPSCWEESFQDYEGVAWYAHTFHVPEAWRGKVVRVRFEAVNYIAQVWVNDQVVGHHEGGYTPFEFQVGDLLEYSANNSIIVRVVGPAVTVERSGELLKDEAPHWRGAVTGGIWQPVRLIATEPTYLQDVFVQPDIHTETAIVQMTIENRKTRNDDVTARVRIFPWRQEGQTSVQASDKIIVEPGENVATMRVRIPNPQLWSPDTPNLYMVETTLLRDGDDLDTRTTRFGMREFTLRQNDFYLNGQRVFLKAGFWEGVYPVTVSYPADREIVCREIRLAKEAGFNTLRPWRKPPPPPILDIADEMGIMIIDAPPIECMMQWPRLTPRTEQYLTSEVEGMVRRDRNHPSVIIWELFNEINRPYLTRYKHPMSLVARNVDPTRVIVDESGGHHASDGSYAYLPYSREAVRMNELHAYLPAPTDQRGYDRLRTIGSSDALTLVSEFGTGAVPDLPRNMERYRREGNPIMPDYRTHEQLATQYQLLMDRNGLHKIWSDLSALCQEAQKVAAVANKLQAEALRLNPNLDGYALHAYTGGDWVIGAGILDLWREPKASYYTMQEVQQPRYLAVRVTPQNVYAERPAMLDVTGIMDTPISGCRLEVTVRGPQRVVVFESAVDADLPTGVTGLMHESLHLDGASGRYQAHAVLRRGADVVTDNTFHFFVMAPADLRVPRGAVAVLEEGQTLERTLRGVGIEVRPFCSDNGEGLPVLVTSCLVQDAGLKQDPARPWQRPKSPPSLDPAKTATKTLNNLIAYVQEGGTAVLLNPWQQIQGFLEAGILMSNVQISRCGGAWYPANHFVHEHPIFSGVPTRCFMGQDYQNVIPRTTIRGLSMQPIAGALGWFIEQPGHDYRGVKDIWGSADVVEVPCGEGVLLLSTLRLVEHLGQDPLADKILYNMIDYVTSRQRKR